jgi:pimeloyl-ACP methyl ester carboxylesterase
MKALFALFLLGVTSTGFAESLEQTYAAFGRLIVTQFVSAPFPHPSRADGHKYKDKVFLADPHYSDSSVAIFIPKGFRETPRVDVVVYFHGWGSSIESTLRRFKLIEQFVESGRNAVLVFPEGPKNASDSSGGKLEDPDGFKRFVDELTVTLREQAGFKRKDSAIGRIILSGHSGAYKVMAAILDRGGLSDRVSEVWLFDALYADADKFLAWWDRRQGRLLNIYTENGGTKDDSEAMMDLLKQRRTPFLSKQDTAITPEELRSGRLVFLSTDLGHNDVVEKRKTFGEFLKTSCLEDL